MSLSPTATLLTRAIKYIKVHTATRWTIRHGLMLLWFTDLMNVTEEVTIHSQFILVVKGPLQWLPK